MGKAGRQRRFLEYHKNNRSPFSFATIPGEIRNRIYDAVILAAFGTLTPNYYLRSYHNWSQQKGELVPWNGFRTLNHQIYEEFNSWLARGTTFRLDDIVFVADHAITRPHYKYIQHLEIDVALGWRTHQQRVSSYIDIGALDTLGDDDWGFDEYQMFQYQAAEDIGKTVLKLAKKLNLKTLALDVYDIREGSDLGGQERTFVKKIEDLVNTNIDICLLDSGLPPESRTQRLAWNESGKKGKRISLATALELIAQLALLEPDD